MGRPCRTALSWGCQWLGLCALKLVGDWLWPSCLLLRHLLKGLTEVSCQPATLSFSFHTCETGQTGLLHRGVVKTDTAQPPYCHPLCQGSGSGQENGRFS